MQSTKTKDGVHIAERNEKFTADFLKLLKTQDKNYVNYQESINKKKIEKLKNGIHFIEDDNSTSSKNPNHTIFVDDDDEGIYKLINLLNSYIYLINI